MPPKCVICYNNHTVKENKCDTCKKCLCNDCYYKIVMFPLCDKLTYKCPFCMTEAKKEYEEINSVVLAKRFKEYMEDSHKNDEAYEEKIEELEEDLEEQSNMFDKIKEELIDKINELTLKYTEVNVEKFGDIGKPLDYDDDGNIYDVWYEECMNDKESFINKMKIFRHYRKLNNLYKSEILKLEQKLKSK